MTSTTRTRSSLARPDDSAPNTGLRDRKRLETRRNLEEAAAYFATTVGLEHATVDAISDRAGVSPRTFFNYFECKEDAILGARPLEVEDAVLLQHGADYADADTIESVVGLLFAVAGPAITDAAGHRSRVEVIYRYPQLIARQLEHMTRVTEALRGAIVRILTQDERWKDADPFAADMVLGVCFSAFRLVVRAGISTDAVPELAQLEARTTALIRDSCARLVA